MGVEASLYQVLQILSLTLFEKTPILQTFQASASQDDLPLSRLRAVAGAAINDLPARRETAASIDTRPTNERTTIRTDRR
jgi:hypothetical protein